MTTNRRPASICGRAIRIGRKQGPGLATISGTPSKPMLTTCGGLLPSAAAGIVYAKLIPQPLLAAPSAVAAATISRMCASFSIG